MTLEATVLVFVYLLVGLFAAKVMRGYKGRTVSILTGIFWPVVGWLVVLGALIGFVILVGDSIVKTAVEIWNGKGS